MKRLIRKAASRLCNKVYDYLKENYPEDTIQWVKQADWELKKISLMKINMSKRPGGRNMNKVRAIAAAIENGEKMDPIVLVEQSNDKYKIADGYHRTLAYKHAGKTYIYAYIASGVGNEGPWDIEMHERKLNKDEEEKK